MVAITLAPTQHLWKSSAFSSIADASIEAQRTSRGCMLRFAYEIIMTPVMIFSPTSWVVDDNRPRQSSSVRLEMFSSSFASSQASSEIPRIAWA